MDAALIRLVWQRAHALCEYCRIPQGYDPVLFEIDHIIARKHRGVTREGNLALACYACNLHKGPNLTGRDPSTGRIVRLFHPRRHRWARHFRWNGALLLGRTAIGRTTIATLKINAQHRVEFREVLLAEGTLPVD